MALIKRGYKHYLIHSVRRNGRVTSRYIASGEKALELHRVFESFKPRPLDRYDRWQRLVERRERERAKRAEREAKAREAERLREVDDAVARAASEVKVATAELMRAAGFHQHRWAWRKKRGGEMVEVYQAILDAVHDEMKTRGMPTPPPPGPEEAARRRTEIAHKESPAGVQEQVDQWQALDATGDGSKSIIAMMTQITMADPTREVLERLVDRWGGDNLAKELLRRKIAAMKAELLADGASAIERQIVERAMICWLDLHVSERLAIAIDSDEDVAVADRNHIRRVADRAHSRYLGCLKSLALIRSRALPALRLSLAVQDGRSGSSAAAVVEAVAPDGEIRSCRPATSTPIEARRTAPTERRHVEANEKAI